MKKIICLLTVLLATSIATNSYSATEFISVINSSGGDFSLLSTWEGVMDNAGNITASDCKVFSHNGATGSIQDGASVTGQTSGATGTVIHATATQVLIDAISGTFQSGEQVFQTENVNYIVISDAGDSPILVARLEQSISDYLDISGITTDSTNYVKITVPTALRHKGILNGGVKYTTTNASYGIVIRGDYTVIEGLEVDGGGAPSNLKMVSSSHSTYRDMIIHNSSYRAANGGGTCENCFIFDWGNYFAWQYGHLRNVSIYATDYDGAFNGDMIVRDLNIYNTAIYNETSNAVYSSVFNCDGDSVVISNDNNKNHYGSVITNWTKINNISGMGWTSVSSGSQDLHINSSSVLIDDGGDLSGYFTTDIDDEVRSGTWDIGADEYNAGGSQNQAPVLAPIGNKSIDENNQLSFNVSASDGDSDPLTLSAVLSPGGDPLSTIGAAFTDNGNGTGTFSWTPDFTQSGTYDVLFTVDDGTDTDTETITITVNDSQTTPPAPTVQISASPLTITDGQQTLLSWSSSNATTCEINGTTVTLNGEDDPMSPTQDTLYTITATGPEGTAVDSVIVRVIPQSLSIPAISFTADTQIVPKGNAVLLTWSTTNANYVYIDNGVNSTNTSDSESVSPEQTTMYTLTASGPDGSTSAKLLIKVTDTLQPPVDGDYGKRYEDKIPIDATLGEYDARRFALITGIVHDEHGNSLENVLVSIEGHLEYGTAETDLNGRFAIPVQGGEDLTVEFEKDRFITSHRTVFVPTNDIAITETIIMIEMDIESTTFAFDGNASSVFVHKSSEITDASGTRSMTMVFQGNNQAIAVDENDNDLFTLETMTTRSSEFEEPRAMPAELPELSGFTYCAELSVDGVERVRFNDPIVIWVDNFLGFNVGEVVPTGFYYRDEARWYASENGIVVKLLDTVGSDGIVDALDIDGDDIADDLDGDLDYADEVAGLNDPATYQPGDTYWRVEITHFTPWDLNWPYGPDGNAEDPDDVDAETEEQDLCPRKDVTDSYVDCRSRIYHEDIPIPGTDISVHYSSNLVDGYTAGIISVPASGSSVPASLKEIQVNVDIAGNHFTQTLPAATDQLASFVWDGTDVFGSAVPSAKVNIQVSYVYDGVYYSAGTTPGMPPQFGEPGSILTTVPTRSEVLSSKSQQIVVSNKSMANNMFAEGWSLLNHHYIDTQEPDTLHKGDGTIVNQYTGRITTVVNDASHDFRGLDIDSDGNLIVADLQNDRVIKVEPDGTISDVRTGLNDPTDVVIDSPGNIYVATVGDSRVRKIDAVTGVLSNVAGTGIAGYNGEGNATGAQLNNPWGLAFDNNGDLLIADTNNHIIRKVDLSTNQISTIAGDPWSAGNSGDGGPATAAKLFVPAGVAVDSSGNVFIADNWNHAVRKIDTAGIITTFAGGVTAGYNGDNMLASTASLFYPTHVAVDSNDNLSLVSQYNLFNFKQL